MPVWSLEYTGPNSAYTLSEITRLGKRMMIRQQALATAQVYLKRFYTRVPIRETNPYVVLVTCVYLACKMEECPAHIRQFTNDALTFWPEFIHNDITKIAECEFKLISEMNSYLICYHPYRTLQELTPKMGLTPDEHWTAWYVINDSYLTDLPLIRAPHEIAICAIMLAVVLKPTQNSSTVHPNGGPSVTYTAAQITAAFQGRGGGPQGRMNKLTDWLAESGVNIEAVIDCTQEIISLYEQWETYYEKQCKDHLGRLIKQKGL